MGRILAPSGLKRGLTSRPLPVQLVLLICNLLDDKERLTKFSEQSDPSVNDDLDAAFERMQLLIDAHAFGLNSHGVGRFYAAARIEANEAPASDPEIQPLSALTTAEVARKATASRDSIAKWRKWPQYWLTIQQLRFQRTGPPSDDE
jgi:hypothetical protein